MLVGVCYLRKEPCFPTATIKAKKSKQAPGSSFIFMVRTREWHQSSHLPVGKQLLFNGIHSFTKAAGGVFGASQPKARSE